MKLEQATAWSLLPVLVLSSLSVVTVPLYYHSLGPDMYALWLAIQTMTGTFGFMDLGLGVSTGRFVGVALGRGDFIAAREYWASGNIINFGFLAIMALFFGFAGSLLGSHWFLAAQSNPDVFFACIWASAAGLFISYYSQGWLVLLQAHLEFRWLAVNRTLFALLTGLGMAAAAWIFHSPFPSILLGIGLGFIQLISFVLRANQTHRIGSSVLYARWSRLCEMFTYTGKTFMALLCGSVFNSLDRWILGRIAGTSSFVPYNIASNLALRAQGLSTSIMGPIFHESSRGVGHEDLNRLAEIYQRSFNLLAPPYILLSIWISFWQVPWLELWLGPQLGLKVSDVLPFLSWAACISAICNISGAQLGPLSLLGTGTIIQSISLACSGLLVWAGWQLHGLEGSAAGLLAGRFVLFFQDALVRRKIRVHSPETRLWKMFGAAALLCWLTHWMAACWIMSTKGMMLMSLLALAGLALIYTFPRRERAH
jgi:O-antigen/teichoic acid export membrane protein